MTPTTDYPPPSRRDRRIPAERGALIFWAGIAIGMCICLAVVVPPLVRLWVEYVK